MRAAETEVLLRRSPFADRTGLRVAALEPDRATVVLPAERAVLGQNGMIHRGAIDVLIEAAGMAASWTSVGRREAESVDLFISHIRGAPEQPLTAEALVVRRGSDLCVCDVEVRDWDRDLVAKAILTSRQ